MLAYLKDRGVVAVAGEDRVGFLQGLVSNDVAVVASGQAVWAALLTPQGKYLADFFMVEGEGELLLDCDAGQTALVVQRLGRFRLRSRVAVRDVSELWRVYAGWGVGGAPSAGMVAADPRLPAAGWRVLSQADLATDASHAEYEAHRLSLGLPSAADLEPEKTVLLEAGFDELNGVSWTKGCYMGQELTARTKYRGLIKRRLVPVRLAGALPPAGTPILADAAEVGTLRTGQAGQALASLRLDAFAATLTCAGVPLVVAPPAWMVLPRS